MIFQSTTENGELMAQARNSLRGKWWPVIGTQMVFILVSAAAGSIPIIGPFLLQPPLWLGWIYFNLTLARQQPADLSQIFEGFKKFGPSVLANFLISVFVLLWMLLLIIPGIIAAFSYAMTFYVIAEDEPIGPLEAIAKSKAMMQGNKWKLFCLQCRFFGWFLVCILTIGIGFLWLIPYMTVSQARFYDDVKIGGHQLPLKDHA